MSKPTTVRIDSAARKGLRELLERCPLRHASIADYRTVATLYEQGNLIEVVWLQGPFDGVHVLAPRNYLRSVPKVMRVRELVSVRVEHPARYVLRVRKQKQPRYAWVYSP